MNTTEIMELGLGLAKPWTVVYQQLEIQHSPGVLRLGIAAERAALTLVLFAVR